METAPDTELARKLEFKDLLVYGVGVILGAGIYALIGKTALMAGNSVWISFIISALIATFTAFSYAELSCISAKTAAEAHYVEAAFKKKLLSFLVGWSMIAMGVASAATVALGFSGYFVDLLLPAMAGVVIVSASVITVSPITVIAAILVIVLAYIGFIGIKESARLNMVFTLIEVFGLLLIIALGAFFILGNGFPAIDYAEMPNGLSGLIGAVTLIFFAYVGFEQIVNVGEEVKNPEKTIPRALVGAILIATLLYILVAVAAVSVVNWQALGESPAPLRLVAETALPGTGGLLSLIALFATANTVLIILIVNARIIYGMSKQGMFPKFLSKVHDKNRTPINAIIISTLIAGAFAFLKDISTVAEMTNFSIFLVFFFVNLALIKMRFTDNYRCMYFKSPVNIGRLPVLALLGAISCFLALASYVVKFTDVITVHFSESFIMSVGILAVGVVVFIILDALDLVEFDYIKIRKRKQPLLAGVKDVIVKAP